MKGTRWFLHRGRFEASIISNEGAEGIMRKKGKVFSVCLALILVGSLISGCGNGSSSKGQDKVLNVAALEGGYGKSMYSRVIKAFEKENPGVKVKLTISKSIEDEITPNMKAGKYPDVVVLGQGRAAGLTESLIKDKNLEDLTGVLNMKVPGESQKVKDKLIPGIVGNLNTNPYNNDHVYLMPMYYAPTGLVYNKGLFKQKGWSVPQTLDEWFALGEKAKKENISLFTYPTAGYLDSYFYSLLADVGGVDFYKDVMTYKKNVWQSPDAKKVLQVTDKLLTNYTAKDTVGNANEQDFTKNQQMILDNKALFMPNGTWIVGEMADAPKANGFEWGLMPMPAVEKDGQRFITTSVESAWIPKAASNKTVAKKFIAFLYSDKAAHIFMKSNAIQPIKGLAEQIKGSNKAFYDVYQQKDVKALVGGFTSTKPVEGVNIKETLFDTANSIITGDKTVAQWQKALNAASEKLRQAKE